jgi:hypothetical protein
MIRQLLQVLTLALLGSPALAAQGAFLVRLGNDTLGLEQYTRTPGRLQGEQVWRAPRTVHRIFTVTFGPGAITRLELVTHNVSGGPGPRETKATLEVGGDTAIATQTDGDSTTYQRTRVAPGTVPWYSQNYALLEELARRARAAGGERYTTSLLSLGATAPWTVEVSRLGRDSMTMLLGPIGRLRLRVDEQGTLLGLSGIGSTMQVRVERLRGQLDLVGLAHSFATRALGPLSPTDSVRATVAGAALVVRYGRPSMRGRVIFGQVVPWNEVWRTGANDATVFETNADLVVGGVVVPAGKYSLWTIPSPAGWKLILNRETGQSGTDYDPKDDLGRVAMRVEPLAQPVEQFTITVAPQSDGRGGVLALEWEKTRASIAFVKR